jgi:hypothetical protein
MRDTLITRFRCSECGNFLEILYDVEAPIMRGVAKNSGIWRESDPTGAEVRYTSLFIEPCRHCIAKLTEPARNLAASIKALI